MNAPTLATLVAARLLEDENLKFSSQVDNITQDSDVYGAEFMGFVTWTLNIDARDWGVKDLDPRILGLELDVYWEDEEDEEGAVREHKVIWPEPEAKLDPNAEARDALMAHPSKENKWDVQAGWDPGSPGPASGIHPRYIHIDFKRRKIEVLF